MAVKRVAILLEIDTSDKKNSSSTCRSDTLGGPSIPGADETYVINVTDGFNPGEEGRPNKSAMLDSCAHELGHVLSGVFKMKDGMHDDPRTKQEFVKAGLSTVNEMVIYSTPEQCRRIYHNEQIAWDIAKKIHPELNEVNAQEALETYEWAKSKAVTLQKGEFTDAN